MYMKEVVVNNQVGLYARPATFFIQKANEFKSSIWIEREERRVNAKSLLGVLSLGIVKGTSINLIANGPDEEVAVNALAELIFSVRRPQPTGRTGFACSQIQLISSVRKGRKSYAEKVFN